MQLSENNGIVIAKPQGAKPSEALLPPTPCSNEQAVCVDVAIPLPIEGLFSYFLDPSQVAKAKIGVRVRVPFRNRETVGFLVAFRTNSDDQKLKKVIAVLDEKPVLSEQMLRLTRWLAEYYFSSWGEAIETAVPKWVKQEKRLRVKEKLSTHSFLPDPPKTPERNLTPEQEKAYHLICAALEEESPKPLLLYGVTGSGKTELYIRAIKKVLERGKGAIVLVPEIALTEQIRRFFFHHFRDKLEILHSKLSDGERFLAWKRIESGEKKILLGPRSAIFAPLSPLGIIVIDEEHESSYKEDKAPRYHAREVALWLAREKKALLIMGSATPSLESMNWAEVGTIRRIDLTERIDNKKLPEVTLVDLKAERDIQKRPVIFSRLLSQEIEANLKRKEGTLLLLNRRGFSTQIHCPACGIVMNCPSCEIALTFHQEDNQLLCHYCNYHCMTPSACSGCSKPLLRFLGFGTEKVESELVRLFPSARVARIDTDAMRRRKSPEAILQDFRDKKIDILVGTQMIAKGFDFPHVTLVGVILADVGLILPDFRSSERTFQLLTQVAGRAGRGEKPGRVIIQTFSPEHPSVAFAKTHDYLKFYSAEMQARAKHRYPPTRHLINILVRSKIEKKAYLFARELRDSLAKKLDKTVAELLGPAPLPFYRLRGHYRWHVLIKAAEIKPTHALLRNVLTEVRRRPGIVMQVDVDPLNIL